MDSQGNGQAHKKWHEVVLAAWIIQRKSSISLRYIEATIGLSNDRDRSFYGLGHPSAQKYALVNSQSGSPP
jgi:hypothetical protein